MMGTGVVVMLYVSKVSSYFMQLKSLISTSLLPLPVPCDNLNNPNNGVINCSLGDDGEDTCSFTCNTGYELTGSDTRTCQSNGSWSGTSTVCRRGS